MSTEKVNNFDELIAGQKLLVKFGAPWCAPCLKLIPILEDLNKNMGIQIISIDTDQNPELAERFGVSSVPTVMAFDNSEAKNALVGLRKINDYKEMATQLGYI